MLLNSCINPEPVGTGTETTNLSTTYAVDRVGCISMLLHASMLQKPVVPIT